MQRFQNILVGVDLSQGDRFVSDQIPPPSVEAIERARWLAKLNSARLTFFYAVDASAPAQRLIEEARGEGADLLSEAKGILNELVSRAQADGLQADLHVGFGKSWLELIRHVLRYNHDLVVAGTRHLGALRGSLLGSTGIKLLRKCPCPVWITQAQDETQIKSVLVAHCLRPVGDLAMELGCSMATLHGAQLHVLHSLTAHDSDFTHSAQAPADVLDAGRAKAQQYIESQLADYEFAHRPHVHIATEEPHAAVLKCIAEHHIELVAMGTIARTGISGIITGNTAERLLPQIPCSILAVKPQGFVSPVSI
jgi:universal stress protein E